MSLLKSFLKTSKLYILISPVHVNIMLLFFFSDSNLIYRENYSKTQSPE